MTTALKTLPLILFFCFGCETNAPLIDQNNIKLTMIDASVTKTYLHVEVGTIRNEEDIIINRNGKEVFRFKASVKDTIIIDTTLKENTSYTYNALGQLNGKRSAIGNEVVVQTLLPSGNDFIWLTYMFGDHDFSQLEDVFIVNEKDIWAVGELMLNDSLGQPDVQVYGAVHWDGKSWKPLKVPIRSLFTDSPYPHALSSVFVIGGRVYAVQGNTLAKYENDKWTEMTFFSNDFYTMEVIREIWGEDDTHLYCVGENGAIFFYNGANQNRLSYKSDQAILDVWGFENSITNNTEIYCLSEDIRKFKRAELVKITENKKITVVSLPSDGYVSKVWSNKGFPIYVGGAKLYENSRNVWDEVNFGNEILIESIRGNALNDIFIAGFYGMIGHYDGKNWKVQYGSNNTSFRSMDVKGNIVAIVGYSGNRAIIKIGKR